ncbi:MAG: ParB/Srx family N-terminal domain-containing protein [Propionicimonas sp.]
MTTPLATTFFEVGDPDEAQAEWGYDPADPTRQITRYGPADKVHPSEFGLSIKTHRNAYSPAYQSNRHPYPVVLVPLHLIWGTQDYVYAAHVRNLAGVPGDQFEPVMASLHPDGTYEVDEHHRVAAAMLRGDTHIRVALTAQPV